MAKRREKARTSHGAGRGGTAAAAPVETAPPVPAWWEALAERRLVFWGIVLALVAVMGATMVHSARLETATFDEPTYLAAGYSYYALGSYRYNYEHPPLPKLLAGLALLPLAPRLPTETEEWRRADPQGGALLFLYRNRVPPEELLFRGRAPFIGLTLVFGVVIAMWTTARFGALAALFALLLYALDPAMVANGRYAATDMIAAVFIFLACVLCDEHMVSGRRLHLVLAGISVGLALASKSSSLMLFGLLPLLGLIRRRMERRKHFLRGLAVSTAVMVVIAILVLALTYMPEDLRMFEADTPMLADVVDTYYSTGRLFAKLGETLHLPAHAWLVGLYTNALTNERGHPSYLFGELRTQGWWYYFPVVFALKTPIALLLALATAFAVGVKGRFQNRGDWLILLIPPLFFFLLAMQAKLNLGQRYILPIYPFLYVLAGAGLARLRGKARALLPAVALLVIFEHILVAPHFLAFMNSLGGGPSRAAAYLADSNVDWGQDLKKLKAYFDREQPERSCVAYWGNNDPAYYGLSAPWVPHTGDQQGRQQADCLAAVSVNYLVGLTIQPDAFQWLREQRPVDKVGYSIYVYDLRKGK